MSVRLYVERLSAGKPYDLEGYGDDYERFLDDCASVCRDPDTAVAEAADGFEHLLWNIQSGVGLCVAGKIKPVSVSKLSEAIIALPSLLDVCSRARPESAAVGMFWDTVISFLPEDPVPNDVRMAVSRALLIQLGSGVSASIVSALHGLHHLRSREVLAAVDPAGLAACPDDVQRMFRDLVEEARIWPS